MKLEWVKIGELGKVKTGTTPPTNRSEFYGDYIPFIKPSDIEVDKRYTPNPNFFHSELGAEYFQKFLVPKGSTCVVTIGSIGEKITQAETDCFTNQQINAVIPNELYNRDYVFYLLKHNLYRVKGANQGSSSGRENVAKSTFVDIDIEVTKHLATQRKIASILSAYDDLIENNLKRIRLLEEKAFVAYKILMSSENLIEGKVGDLADVKSGFAFKGADWTDDGFSVIKIKNIGNNDIDLTDCSLIPENIAEAAVKFKLNAGDLLIAMTGATVGKIGMMPKTETSFYLNQRVGIFKPKVENAELFLFCFYNEPSAKDAVESLASGAAQPNISGGQLESIKLFYPKLETVTEFGNSIKSHFELIWNLKQQNTKLREARDILLPKLMNGQIEV